MSTASLIQTQASFAPFLSSSSFSKHTFLAAVQPTAFVYPSQNYSLERQNLVILLGRCFPILVSEVTTEIPLSEYLVERLGFTQEDSLAACKKVQARRKRPGFEAAVTLISCENADSVIGYLQDENECGIHPSNVKEIIRKIPSILTADLERTIKPKIKTLQDLGISTSDLTRVLFLNPTLYLDRDLSPTIQALRGILESDEMVVQFFMRLGWGSNSSIFNNLIPNVTMFEDEFGIPRETIQILVTKQPTLFMLKPEVVRDGLFRLENKWGIRRDSKVFLRALHPFLGLSEENINSKCQVFRDFGWPEDIIMSLIQRAPSLFTSSEARLKKSLEFYMNELGFKPGYMATRPALFTFSLENRVLPRSKVLEILRELGHVKPSYQLYSSLLLNDSKFYEKFIRPYPELKPELVELYINKDTE